jgi:hypothetical protein
MWPWVSTHISAEFRFSFSKNKNQKSNDIYGLSDASEPEQNQASSALARGQAQFAFLRGTSNPNHNLSFRVNEKAPALAGWRRVSVALRFCANQSSPPFFRTNES